jgi:hypothetical protein
MSNPKLPLIKMPSLVDYLVRYDLPTILEEARLDYTQSSSGTPRLLNQKDIAARFRAARKPDKPAP